MFLIHKKKSICSFIIFFEKYAIYSMSMRLTEDIIDSLQGTDTPVRELRKDFKTIMHNMKKTKWRYRVCFLKIYRTYNFYFERLRKGPW